jgi:hypothetical protein
MVAGAGMFAMVALTPCRVTPLTFVAEPRLLGAAVAPFAVSTKGPTGETWFPP